MEVSFEKVFFLNLKGEDGCFLTTYLWLSILVVWQTILHQESAHGEKIQVNVDKRIFFSSFSSIKFSSTILT